MVGRVALQGWQMKKVDEEEGKVKEVRGWTLKVLPLRLAPGISLRMVQSPGSFFREMLLFFSSQARKEENASKLAGSCLRILRRRGWRRLGGTLRGSRWSCLQAERKGKKQLRHNFTFYFFILNKPTLKWRKDRRMSWTQKCKLGCA